MKTNILPICLHCFLIFTFLAVIWSNLSLIEGMDQVEFNRRSDDYWANQDRIRNSKIEQAYENADQLESIFNDDIENNFNTILNDKTNLSNDYLESQIDIFKNNYANQGDKLISLYSEKEDLLERIQTVEQNLLIALTNRKSASIFNDDIKDNINTTSNTILNDKTNLSNNYFENQIGIIKNNYNNLKTLIDNELNSLNKKKEDLLERTQNVENNIINNRSHKLTAEKIS